MTKKTLFLIAGIISLIVLIGSITESDPKTFFGYSVNHWFVKVFWLLNTILIFNAYREIKKQNQKN
jgi:hypothetical protein